METKHKAEMVYFKRVGSETIDSIPVAVGTAHKHVNSSLIVRIEPLYEKAEAATPVAEVRDDHGLVYAELLDRSLQVGTKLYATPKASQPIGQAVSEKVEFPGFSVDATARIEHISKVGMSDEKLKRLAKEAGWEHFDGDDPTDENYSRCYGDILRRFGALYASRQPISGAGMTDERLEQLVREYGNTPVCNAARTRKDVMRDIYALLSASGAMTHSECELLGRIYTYFGAALTLLPQTIDWHSSALKDRESMLPVLTKLRALSASGQAGSVQAAQSEKYAEIIEQIAQSWDGCMYSAVGEDINIGASIREQYSAIAKEKAK